MIVDIRQNSILCARLKGTVAYSFLEQATCLKQVSKAKTSKADSVFRVTQDARWVNPRWDGEQEIALWKDNTVIAVYFGAAA